MHGRPEALLSVIIRITIVYVTLSLIRHKISVERDEGCNREHQSVRQYDMYVKSLFYKNKKNTL